LFSVLRKYGIDVPVETLEYVADIDKQGSKWERAVNYIMDALYTSNCEDREMTDEEVQLFDNVKIALGELCRWAKTNKLGSKKGNTNQS
jgi:hypothetical protein